jgi:hypothetical protein
MIISPLYTVQGRWGVFGISRRGAASAADVTIRQTPGRYRAVIGGVVALAVVAGCLALGSGRAVSVTLLSVVGATPS